MKKIVYLLFISIVLSACYTDKEEILYPPKDCTLSSNVSYKADLAPILESRCYSCHAAGSAKFKGGNIVLDSYDTFQKAVDTYNLMQSINHSGNVSPMPQNDNKLTTCQISAFESWVFDGQKNN